VFILETIHIYETNHSNLNVKLTNICILEQEQFDLKKKKNHNKLKWSVLLLGLSCTETRA
jgi:hypothetical protein